MNLMKLNREMEFLLFTYDTLFFVEFSFFCVPHLNHTELRQMPAQPNTMAKKEKFKIPFLII